MPVNITDVSAFTDPITAPAGADARTAASVIDPVQKLSNRTRYLLDLIEADTDLAPPILREIVVLQMVPGVTSGGAVHWGQTGSLNRVSLVNFGHMELDLRGLLPHGAAIQDIAVMNTPGASRTGTDRPQVALIERDLDWATPAADSGTVVVSAYGNASTTALHNIDLSTSGHVVDSTKQQIIRFYAGHDGAANPDTFHGIRIRFDDPGPRNF